MSKLALELIQHAKETGAKTLDLGNCGLTELPDSVFELVELEELYLCGEGWFYNIETNKDVKFRSQNQLNENSIKHLSVRISQLYNLKIILANGSHGKKWNLKDLSPLMGLRNLQQLNISCTQVSNLDSLKSLQNLQLLDVSYSEITDLNPLKHIQNLRQLYVTKTQVSDLSPLMDLQNLQQLYVGYTEIIDLSPLKKLINLKKLKFYNTHVLDLSPLQSMQNLQQLDISSTQVSDLSPLKKLIAKGIPVKWEYFGDDINIRFCPLTNPPIEIAKQGNKAILNYWNQIEIQGGTETINEAKLIIVGEGGTGKTTLFKKLIDPNFDLHKTPTEETQGINIHEGLKIKEGFHTNLWDFGGQELQYMTHQFFLTPNAVYVLMMDARGEAPNLAYWFKIISLLGKDKSGKKVSLVLVLNKKKNSTGIPQYQDLLKIYSDDFDYQFIEVDLAKNDKRWDSLREAIEQRLVNLPIVKNALPKKWKPIRESLRATAQRLPYIDAARLANLCQPFQVTQEVDQFLMTEYLHQLGSLLHFQSEEDNLIDLIVLSPEWVVEGVYTVLKSEQIKEILKGKFTASDMTRILCDNQYKVADGHKHYTRVDAQKLLQLMSKNNFDICYKSENGKFVAAQLLPDDRPPAYRWNKFNAALQFRYQYPIMPKGLMSRLIVRLSDYLEIIDGQEIVWKKGAILNMKFDGSLCRVLMREEDGQSKTGLRQIVIEVLEDEPPYHNRKYALQRVRQEIESLHQRWFKNITAEQIVPCNCEECYHKDKPHTYQLTDLMGLKKPRAYCLVQEEFVPLRQLLEGVYEPKEIDDFKRKKDYDSRETNN